MTKYQPRFKAGDPIWYLDDLDQWQPGFIISGDMPDWPCVSISPFPWTDANWSPGSPMRVSLLENTKPRTEDQP